MNWPLQRVITFLAIGLLAASSACAYTVALTDGRLIQFQKYRTTETALLYVDDQGREIAVPLSSIDLDRTRQLNSGESPALDLPGMKSKGLSKTAEPQPSLGEIARGLHKKGATDPNQRVFTNDDVASAPSTTADALSITNSNPDTWRDHLGAVKATVDSLENTDANSLARKVLGNLDIDFPGRRAWEEELFSRKGAVSTTLQNASKQYEEYYSLRDVLKRAGTLSKGDEDKLSQARLAAASAINQAQVQQSKFESTVDKGKQRALEWKRK
jgi:hypothetical protein